MIPRANNAVGADAVQVGNDHVGHFLSLAECKKLFDRRIAQTRASMCQWLTCTNCLNI